MITDDKNGIVLLETVSLHYLKEKHQITRVSFIIVTIFSFFEQKINLKSTKMFVKIMIFAISKCQRKATNY